MGCGSSNQVHEVGSKNKKSTSTELNQKYMIEKQSTEPLCYGQCYLFGQTAIQKKVVCYNAFHNDFETLSSRVRIPTPKIRLSPIEILYQESQQVILPDLFTQLPRPPFNKMFGTFFKTDVIFLCGGTTYENDDVTAQAYFYLLNLDKQSKNKPQKTGNRFKRFQKTTPMHQQRYNHFGVFKVHQKDGLIYVFGGTNKNKESLATCERFSINDKKWVMLPEMKVPRSQGFAFLYMTKIYVFGGIANQNRFPISIQVFDPQTNTWNDHEFKLHRGIRGGLLVTPKPNQILVFGGLNYENNEFESVIRYNLLHGTYIWETDMPIKMSRCKAAVTEDRALIFGSGKNNQIQEYNFKEKQWKNLSYGFANHIPVEAIQNFTCATEPLLVQLKQQKPYQQVKELLKNQTYLYGNENYPFICKIIYHEKKILQKVILPVPINMRLCSKMELIKTQKGVYALGGTDLYTQKGKNQLFFCQQLSANCYELPPLQFGRYDAKCQLVSNRIYVIGGFSNGSSNNENLQNLPIQIYDIEANKWFHGSKLTTSRAKHKTLKFGENKILIVGGYNTKMINSALVQIYDTVEEQIIKAVEIPELFPEKTREFHLYEVSGEEPQSANINIKTLFTKMIKISNSKQKLEPEKVSVQDNEEEEKQFQYVMDDKFEESNASKQEKDQGEVGFHIIEFFIFLSDKPNSVDSFKKIQICINKKSNQVEIRNPENSPVTKIFKPIQNYDKFCIFNEHACFLDFKNESGYILEKFQQVKEKKQVGIFSIPFVQKPTKSYCIDFKKIDEIGYFSLLDRTSQ